MMIIDYEFNVLGDFSSSRVQWSALTISPGGSESEQKCTSLLFDIMSDHLCKPWPDLVGGAGGGGCAPPERQGRL